MYHYKDKSRGWLSSNYVTKDTFTFAGICEGRETTRRSGSRYDSLKHTIMGCELNSSGSVQCPMASFSEDGYEPRAPYK